MREFIDGNTAIVRGALAAGCDFFAGYPITPATAILLEMMRDLPRVGGVAIQGEDEIASLGFCIGAAMSGRRAFTATSGPGISLYSENIGLAIMGEVPLVIVDVQRMGPATGGATTVAQGDAQFIRWCTSGGYPIIALCPATVADCYTLTMRAFDLAERFRCPVFLLTDKEVATTMDTVEIGPHGIGDGLSPLSVREREVAPADCRFVPCDYPALDENVPMSAFGGPHLLRFTTSTHDAQGYLTKDPAQIERLNRHLVAKIEAHRDEIDLVRSDVQEGARTLLVSYGITARSVEEAVRQARAAGHKVSTLTLLSMWPLPETALRQAIEDGRGEEGIQQVVVAELNDGQVRREIERLACGRAQVTGVHRLDGELITPQQLVEALGRSDKGGLL
jgi:2-oxoglutarate ferredoxin oxidoreductase subunit alpha